MTESGGGRKKAPVKGKARSAPPKARGARPGNRRPATPRKGPKRLDELTPSSDQFEYELRLYVAGQSPRSLSALGNLERLCEQHLKGRCQIEVIDLLQNPHLAEGDQIVAIPTLVRKLPPPLRKIIGDLSNAEQALVGLDLKQRGEP